MSVLVSGCGELVVAETTDSSTETGPAISNLRPGLELLDGAHMVEGHLVEMLVHEGHIYAADSNSGVTVVRLEPDGSLTTTQNDPDPDPVLRCTSVALHAASDTLYCGADEPSVNLPPSVDVYDISTPGQTVLREQIVLDHWATRDLVVVGDQLVLHQFEGGIRQATIGEDGQLSPFTDPGIEGNARFGVELGTRLVSLFSDPEELGVELRLFDPNDFSELDRLALAGTPLGLSADPEGGRVGVGLGSGGMAIVRLADDTLSLDTLLEPPGVVSAGLVEGDLAVAVALNGAFAWDLSQDQDRAQASPRLFGFGPSAQLSEDGAGNMLHGLIHAGELLVSDWIYIERWALDPTGEVLSLDIPRGLHVQPEGPIAWQVHNPGATTLRLDIANYGQPIWSGEITAGALAEVRLAAETHAAILSPEQPLASLVVETHDPSLPEGAEALWRARMTIVERNPEQALPPATGDLFPELVVENADDELYTFPLAGGTQTIWFSPDCALMWPEIQDLAWLERSGWDLGRGTPILLTDFAIDQSGYLDEWDLDSLELGLWGAAGPAIGDANAELAPGRLEDPFIIDQMPGDRHPIDYVLDSEGRVRSIERTYRGAWPLVVDWPW